jgi:signal transduction histidine kinase
VSTRLRIYVTLVAIAAALLLVVSLPSSHSPYWVHFALWALMCVGAELLWLPSVSREATASMASTVNLATLMLWGQGPAMIAVGASTLIASVLFQKKPWVRATFNTAQIVITMWVTGAVVVLLGGRAEGLGPLGRLALNDAAAIRLGGIMVIAFLVYATVNRSLVTVAVAWSTDRPFLRALREDWMFRERLNNDVALFFLAPLMVFAYGTVGYLGLLLFYAPLQMAYETHKRYLELRDAQNQMIHQERMAAKGEMAAEIGHELNNQLVAIHGRAQMLSRDAQRGVYDNVERHSQIILEQSERVKTISKGLMDFSNAKIQVERLDLNALVLKSIEFVRPQNRFDQVEWEMRLATSIPELRADSGQIHQVLINLFVNAADAMKSLNGARRIILVSSEYDERRKEVRVRVQDNGSGIDPEVLPRIFEPQFTTKPDGHGFGLSTSYRIVTNHGGKIVATSPPGRGAQFTVTLPVHGPGSWS